MNRIYRLSIIVVFTVTAGFLLSAWAAKELQPIGEHDPFKVLGKQRDTSLQSEINDIFAHSDEILIKYDNSPPTDDSGYHNKEDIEKGWEHVYGTNCGTSCNYNSNLQEILSSSRRVIPACPRPLTFLIIFRKQKREVARIYVHHSGQCFLLGSKWYLANKSIREYLPDYWEKGIFAEAKKE